MSIGISQLSEQRVELIRNAESLEQATEMGFIDGLIDRFFNSGAKREAIVELYNMINQNAGDTSTRMRAMLDLRSLIRPEHRSEVQFNFTEHPNGTCSYTLSMSGRLLDQRDGISDASEIAALRHADNAIKVDHFLLGLQNFAPTAASLVQRSDRFLVEQGRVGDCYVLAAMIGIMANPEMQSSIEQMAEVTSEGKLRLKFDANMSAQLTEYFFELPDEEASSDTFDAIIGNAAELDSLRAKGYDLVQENGLLQLDISADRLKLIIGNLKSAETNSLIVNILEHFVGNLLQYTQEVPVARIEDEEKWVAILGQSKVDEMKIHQTETKLSPLRSNRDSLLAHYNRAGNYNALVTNLLGYQTGATEKHWNVRDLSNQLTDIQENGRCLAAGGKHGFVYVGMAYGKADAAGRIHGRHALVLKDLVLRDDGEVEGVLLINPWGNRDESEYYSLEDIIQRGGVLTEFLPPNASNSPAPTNSAPPTPPLSVKNGTTYVMFDQYA